MRRKIVFLPYDFDTAIGINNEGTLEFSYNLEDIDQTEGGADIFNGQQSVLWKNLRATYFDELRSMFQTLRSTGALSYEKVERMFEEHQAKWPEAVFNEDAWFKYLAPLVEKGNASYLSMLQGSKAEQRKWWLYNRFRYMDSKYNAGDSLSDVITVRGYAKSDITIEPYADVYASVKYGSYLVQKRAARHMKTTLECPLDNVNDTEIYIYSASQLMDVGDLSGLLVGYADFSKAVRLQSLKLGDASVSYSNGNLKELYLGNNELLRTIDVRNCPALTQAVVITGCSNIEHVYFDGTSITGLELPDGGILKTLHLPSSMTALSILNQPSLTEFVFPAGAALTTLRLENVSTAVDSLMMVRAMPANSRVRVIGFNWSMQDFEAVMDLYDHLDTMRGIDESGGNLDMPQLYGTINVPTMTTDQLREAKSRYNDINIEADAWTYRVRFFDGDTLLHTEYVQSGESVTDPVTAGTIPQPERESVGHTGYIYNGWDKDLTNITADRDIYAQYTETHAYEVTFKNWDDSILLVKLVPEGATCADPVQTGEIETPTRESDENYVYSFLGWTGASLVNVTSDRIVTARYSQVTSYTITFVNYDNTVLLTWYRQTGASIVDPIRLGILETPVQPDNWSSHYEYVFSKWDGQNADGSLPKVNGNRTYKATFTTKSFYGYTFKDYNGSVLYREKWYIGDTATDPVAEGRMPTPTRNPDENYNYEFWKWDRVFPHPVSQYNSHLNMTAKYRTDAVHIVTFKDWDGAVLDEQEVRDGYNAVDPVKTGRIATPLRPSTQQYDYTYSGWGRTFSEVTADIVVTASYASVLRKYTVTFMKEDNVTEAGRATVEYGKYPKNVEFEDWPVLTADSPNFLYGWNPSVNVTVADTTTYPQWKSVLTDSWADIFAAEEDGTYREKYSIGDVKLLDLGSEGVIPMRIVGFDCDELSDGSGNAKISWIAVSPLNSKIRCGYRAIATTDVSIERFLQKNSAALGDYYESTNQGVESSVSLSSFTITAEEDTEVTIWAFVSSETEFDFLDVWLDDALLFYGMSGTSGNERQHTIHLAAGESATVLAQYSKDKRTDEGQDIARVRFISQGSITVAQGAPTEIKTLANSNSSIRGWPTYTMRTKLHEDILPLFPEIVRNHVCEVKKSSTIAYSSSEDDAITNDSIWVPSARELNYYGTNSAYIEKTGPCYNTAFPTQDSRYARKNGAPAGYTALRSYYRISTGYPAAFIGDLGALSAYNGYTSPLFINIGFCT